MIKYAIVANYYFYELENPNADEDGVITKPVYMGLEKERKIFIFEHDLSENTILFDKAEDAGLYLDVKFPPKKVEKRGSFESLMIVEVKVGD